MRTPVVVVVVVVVGWLTKLHLLSAKKFKKDSKLQATDLLDSSIPMVEEMQKLHSELFHFDKLSAASHDFEKFATVATNEKVARAVTATLDQVSIQVTMLNKLDYFITLHIPTIEDGGK